MNKQDKFFEQFKEAAQQTEQHRFPGFDDVWQQVETRLDKENKPKVFSINSRKDFNFGIWNFNFGIFRLAVGAALLAMIILGMVYFQGNKSEVPLIAVENEERPVIIEDLDNILDADTINAQKALVINNITQKEKVDKSKVEQAKINTSTVAVNNDSVLQKNYLDALVVNVELDSTKKYISLARPILPTELESEADSLFYNFKTTKNANMSTLDEVVVTGYASQKKVSITGSVATLKRKSLNQNSRKVENQLQGSVAGLHVSPGNIQYSIAGASPEIRIRGNSTINSSNAPMYIVNGKIVRGSDVKNISPDKILDLKILKDASATAIYGSRAQHGVVLITTRKLTKKQQRMIAKMDELLRQNGAIFNPGANPLQYSNQEAYNPLIENPFTNPKVNPLSTFSIDVDNASYSNIRRFINNGQAVPKDAVRIEEMINYFKYQYKAPENNDPLAWQTEYSDAPWNASHKLLRFALKAKDIPQEDLPNSNIVFLLDVSGSMEQPNKLPLLRSSMKVLVDQFREQDKVSIVVYAGAAGLVLPATSGAQKQTIMDALDKLSAGGSTAGGEGIELAYKIAAENFVQDGNNRVVLATDGDFNVGISSQGDLQTLIEAKRKSGIFLTCLGFGMGNYKDNTLETLADKGNGNYAYIDNMQESNRFLGKEFKGSMYTVAKDVKLQIEFNPALVQSYRLIGYENRKLNDEDFVNDAVDAGEMGAGHTVTALYEIIPVGISSTFSPALPALKYSNTQVSNGNAKELATVKFRYKTPDGDTSTELVHTIAATSQPLQNASEDYRFAAAVAWFGLKLRNSELVPDKDADKIINLAKGAASFDPDGYRAECIRLMELTK